MNFDDIVVKESPGICRCCLSEGCYKDLGTEYTWMNETEVYADMLLDCFDIGITQHNDGPNGSKRLICEVCITRLRDACNFKKQVLDSEKRFIDMLGRGDFRPKVLMYQPQSRLKEESLEESAEDVLNADIEYLEDMDFGADDEEIKTEAHVSLPSTSEASHSRPKRGRPKKEEDRPEKVKKQKVAKETAQAPVTLDRDSCAFKNALVKLFTIIIENSTVMPFRFHRNTYHCFFCGCPFSDSVVLKQHNKEEHSDTKIRAAFKSLLRNSKIKFEISEINCKLCPTQFTNLEQLLNHLENTHCLKYNHALKTELYAFKLTEEKLICEDCGEQFQFFSTLLKHIHALHNKNVPYVCEICGMGFVARQNVAAHVRNVHSKDMPCKRCLNLKRDPNNCKHKIAALKRKCVHCSQILDSPYLYKRHLITVHDVKNYQFKCDLCDKTFAAKAPLIQHKERVHLKQKSFACEVCGYRAFNRNALRLHMVSHNDSRPFECEFCKKTFQRKKTLEFHRRIHTNDKRCVCKECGKAFVQTTSLKLHYRVHHPADGKKEPDWN